MSRRSLAPWVALVCACSDPAPVTVADASAPARDAAASAPDAAETGRDAAAPAPDAEPAPADAQPASDDAAVMGVDAVVVGDDAASVVADAATPYDGGATCDFLDLDLLIARCGNGYGYLRRWSDVNMAPACLPYWTLLGGTYTSSSAAITGAGCSDACHYRAGISVSFVDHCGRRNGYIVFTDPDPAACPDVYEFSTGLFPSQEAWARDTPCGDAGP